MKQTKLVVEEQFLFMQEEERRRTVQHLVEQYLRLAVKNGRLPSAKGKGGGDG